MAETSEKAGEKKKTNPLVFVGIGCLALLVLLGIGSTIVAKFFAKKVGTGLVEKAIESKTGVKTNIEDLEQGKISFTDEKTGTKVDIGSNTVPETFPKDFPLYPGAKVASSLSGEESGKSNGFWLTMSSSDSVDAVASFYKTELTKNGWTVESTFTANGMTSQTVKKGTWSGSLSTGKNSSDSETQIVIILGQENE
ncbi:MAG TPA: hypothetical protein VJB96_01345 [Patescibacteria group bacterium]|nr:hypothetical protein [Patescibacteria group bacterium]